MDFGAWLGVFSGTKDKDLTGTEGRCVVVFAGVSARFGRWVWFCGSRMGGDLDFSLSESGWGNCTEAGVGVRWEGLR